MSTSADLRRVFTEARPLIEQWLDIAEQIGALREVATAHGLDWSQVKALLKAQIQDERDEAADGKRVKRIIEKAEFASAYADMLGLGSAILNENNFIPADEADDQSTAARMDVQPANSGTIASTARQVAITAGTQAPPVDTIQEPPRINATVPLWTGSATRKDAEAAAPEPAPLAAQTHKLRPYCLHAGDLTKCGGYGKQHCVPCLKAHADAEGEAA